MFVGCWCLIFYLLSEFRSARFFNTAKTNENEDDCWLNKTLCRHPIDDRSFYNWNMTSALKPNDMSDIEFAESSCYCDADCGSYRDCCSDAAARYWTGVDYDHSLWTCLPVQRRTVQVFNETFSIYAIGGCPSTEGQNLSDLSAMCRMRTFNTAIQYSYLMDVPVLSLDSNRTYTNIFCAQCNSDAVRLANWNVSYRCNARHMHQLNISLDHLFQPKNYQPGKRQWIDHSNPRFPVTCDLIIDQLQNLNNYAKVTGGRRCLPSIESCASHWTDTDYNQKCSSYTQYVVNKLSNKLYKNPDCAICNDLRENETECLSLKKNFIPHKGKSTGRRSFTFSGLMDFSFGGSDRVGLEMKCSQGEIFDHLYHRCHAIVCGVNYINQAGSCQLMEPISKHANSWLNSSCPRLGLVEGVDYVRLENNSLVLNKTGEIFQPEEYESNPDDRNITICIDQSVQGYFFKYSILQKYLSDACLAISLAGLGLHIIIHAILPKLCNLPGKNLLSLTCTLFVAQLLFLTAIDAKDNVSYGVCTIIGVLIHWCYLSAFFWMSVMGFDISRTFTGFSNPHLGHGRPGYRRRSIYLNYSLYAWGFPTLVVTLGFILDLTHLLDSYAPQYGSHLCWICNKRGLVIFFIFPVMLLILANLVLFTLTVRSILKQKRAAQFAIEKNQTYSAFSPALQATLARNQHHIRFILYFKLAVIMGLGWLLGVVAGLAELPVLWYPFIVLNALQGAFIFITFDCKLKIYYMVYKRITKRPHPSDNSFGPSHERANTMGHSQRTTATYNVERTE